MGATMEFRYLGFDQRQNERTYRFAAMTKGEATRQFVVTADLTLFQAYRIGIQEGPSLSASKLASDLEKCADGTHELTGDDLRAHADARALAETRRAEARKNAPRRPGGTRATHEQSPWRNFGI